MTQAIAQPPDQKMAVIANLAHAFKRASLHAVLEGVRL